MYSVSPCSSGKVGQEAAVVTAGSGSPSCSGQGSALKLWVVGLVLAWCMAGVLASIAMARVGLQLAWVSNMSSILRRGSILETLVVIVLKVLVVV